MREKLAKLAHEQWSGRMRYLFSKCYETRPDEGQAFYEDCLVIPPWAVKRWSRQAKTRYCDLSLDEQDSDRKEADKFLAVFQAELGKARETNKKLHRRCQLAESAGKDNIEGCRRQGQSLGRRLSAAGYLRIESELGDAKAHIEHLEKLLGEREQEREDMLAGTLEGKLQEKLDSANHDYSELVKERADYVAENKRLRDEIRAKRQSQTCPSCNRTFATQP